MPSKSTPTRKAVPDPSTAVSGRATGRGGSITAAAEQMAAAMAKPGAPIDTVKGMDHNLGDISSAMETLAGGLKNAANTQLDAMPDEQAAHERLMQLSKQMQQTAQEAALIQADQRRRNAMDHERLDNARRNERGYDWTANQ